MFEAIIRKQLAKYEAQLQDLDVFSFQDTAEGDLIKKSCLITVTAEMMPVMRTHLEGMALASTQHTWATRSHWSRSGELEL